MFSEITELVGAVAEIVCGHTVGFCKATRLGNSSLMPPCLWLNDPSGPRRAVTLNHMSSQTHPQTTETAFPIKTYPSLKFFLRQLL